LAQAPGRVSDLRYAEWKAAQSDAEGSAADGVAAAGAVDDTDSSAKAVSVTFEVAE
jgi:hypothetical protein